MKVFTCSQIRHIDSYTIKHEPIASVDLMERASVGLMSWIAKRYSSNQPFFIFAGPGNNGGDGIALARLLISIGFNVVLFILRSDNYSTDNLENQNRILSQGFITPVFINSSNDFPNIPQSAIIVDCLFGSGLTRPLEGIAASLVVFLNSLNAHIIAVDIPSGLFGEDNPTPNPNPCIRATVTLTLQFPKLCFFMPENFQFTGQWHLVDIGLHPQVIADTSSPYNYIDSSIVQKISIKRSRFDHKGVFGHCLLITGSYGMMGASVLAANACLRTGAGLVTVHVPRLGYSIIQQSVPEAMVDVDDNDWIFTNLSSLEKYTAIGIGPGLGTEARTVKGFINLISSVKCPMVIDADGINILAQSPELLNQLPANTILTPHVGEFNRLFGTTGSGNERLSIALEMSAKYNIIIVIKGAYTQVVCPNGNVFFNSTGNPGMATGGSGDVLTGMITSLLGQGLSPINAAIGAVYLHGKAGDIAAESISESSLKASDIIDGIGKAIMSI
jgi:ADP-dependent NAD(P)H-hydrate dehydratase / NAD(P)H-hydrate epimerase